MLITFSRPVSQNYHIRFAFFIVFRVKTIITHPLASLANLEDPRKLK